ncbi:MAG: hypothetical protein IID43_02945 [Planctomycetes bacterium]|nr:hypothetical protein [Planctomycetota bacterium]
MAKKNETSDETADPFARLCTDQADKNKAQKWFTRALELGEKRQFMYAIEYYVNGLEYWPDAVDEACKPLHGCGVAWRQTGGKKPGLKDTMRRSLTDKDPKKALLNSLWLFGHDPDNFAYIEGIARNASRLRAEDTAKWGAGVALKSLENSAKATPKQFQALVNLLEELGDRAAERDESTFAVEAYQTGVETLSTWRSRIPRDHSVEMALKNLSTKLTILKGKYKTGDSYRDSIADLDAQVELHDEERSVQADDRLDELIEGADRRYQADPDHPSTLAPLIDLLCRREREDEEVRAIGLLVDRYKRTDDYRWKQLADDIRMKQLGRTVREAKKAGDAKVAQEAQITQLRFDLRVYKERQDRYPTDSRFKFEYGVRCFRAGRFDDAIPLFQNARSDPKNRTSCGLYLGRCFYRKGYHSQAIDALEMAIGQYEIPDDDLAKNLHYWLARACQDGGKIQDAQKTYGKILQMDYNYRDVRARLDGLPASGD